MKIPRARLGRQGGGDPRPESVADGGDGPSRAAVVRGADARLAVEIRGTGTPVLALHGLTAHRAVWGPLARRLPPGVALVAPDLPARGASPPPASGRYRLRDELARLRGALRSLDLRPRVVVGHSRGAALAVALACTEPAVRGLVLCCPVSPWTSRPRVLDLLPGGTGAARAAGRVVPLLRRPVTRWVLRHRVYADPTRADAAAVDRYAGPWASPSRAAELPRLLADWNPAALRPYFPPPPIPVRVLAGRADRRVPPEDAARLARAVAGSLRVESGAAHGLPEERPGAVASALVAVAAAAEAGVPSD